MRCISELFEDMEPVAGMAGGHVETVGEAALFSIAVSLKRIADAWGDKKPQPCEHGVLPSVDCETCFPIPF